MQKYDIFFNRQNKISLFLKSLYLSVVHPSPCDVIVTLLEFFHLHCFVNMRFIYLIFIIL